jgi:hypothetical protein
MLHSRNATRAQMASETLPWRRAKNIVKRMHRSCFYQLKQAGYDFCCTAAEQQDASIAHNATSTLIFWN